VLFQSVKTHQDSQTKCRNATHTHTHTNFIFRSQTLSFLSWNWRGVYQKPTGGIFRVVEGKFGEPYRKEGEWNVGTSCCSAPGGTYLHDTLPFRYLPPARTQQWKGVRVRAYIAHKWVHVTVHSAYWYMSWVSTTWQLRKHVIPTYRVFGRLWTTFKISQHLTKILIHVHKHKKLSRGTTHDQAGRPKLK